MRFLLLFALVFSVSCSQTQNNLLEKALASDNEKIRRVMDSLEQHEVQILFTEILRDAENKINFKDYEFQVDDNNYFYPASTVKFPIAVLALEKLKEDDRFDRNSKFFIEGDSLITTFSDEIRKIFAVSDNEANNRLFEYLGQDEINNRLKNKGIEARISHRLSTPDSDNLTTKPLVFYVNDSTTTPTIPIISKSLEPLTIERLKKGKGYLDEGELINEPMDFSFKNYLPITSLHNMMKQLMFPKIYPKEQQFQLTESDREFLLNMMKISPKQAGYDSDEYYDSYVKFLIFGDDKSQIPDHIEIYNKVGYAYGYLTDCAYIKNKKTGKEYIITATIHVNKNRIFNDGVYETETIGIPFLAELGRQLVVE
ncbi:serine hydrolase [Aureibaculum sp. 2210JD6-5]|uniref:serine hydrolase n=1 Tax=Aureibaculum sp. 2210JD6-5 TaxID=3103957 RepID=UPI002AADC7C8|nr:serine hydrolase [Aureibaculum sp. 2210JD6-5]MDY7395460.1 serine hydrolase [Aureibaculum sp. 2210JD6-5]